MLVAAALSSVAFAAPAAAADVVTYNSAPAAGWNYGSGNNYAPSNTAVLTTTDGSEIALRMHQTFQVAPASVGNLYSFALGTTPISFDWGISSPVMNDVSTLTALLTLTNIGTGSSFSYNPFAVGNDNATGVGSGGSFAQNSFRLNWAPIGFNALVDSTYQVNLTVGGLAGGTRSFDAFAQLGAGATAAVPEPATWALMLFGFGFAGIALRRNGRQHIAQFA